MIENLKELKVLLTNPINSKLSDVADSVLTSNGSYKVSDSKESSDYLIMLFKRFVPLDTVLFISIFENDKTECMSRSNNILDKCRVVFPTEAIDIILINTNTPKLIDIHNRLKNIIINDLSYLSFFNISVKVRLSAIVDALEESVKTFIPDDTIVDVIVDTKEKAINDKIASLENRLDKNINAINEYIAERSIVINELATDSQKLSTNLTRRLNDLENYINELRSQNNKYQPYGGSSFMPNQSQNPQSSYQSPYREPNFNDYMQQTFGQHHDIRQQFNQMHQQQHPMYQSGHSYGRVNEFNINNRENLESKDVNSSRYSISENTNNRIILATDFKTYDLYMVKAVAALNTNADNAIDFISTKDNRTIAYGFFIANNSIIYGTLTRNGYYLTPILEKDNKYVISKQLTIKELNTLLDTDIKYITIDHMQSLVSKYNINTMNQKF